MSNKKYKISNIRKPIMKQNFLLIIFLIISNLCINYCQDEEPEPETEYENNILIFNHTKLNAGSINKNGDLIIEYYSEENYYDIPNSILYYGLSKNGRQFFSNETSYTQEKNIEIDEMIDIAGYYNNFKIYDSKSLFVSKNNDYNKKNQYLFSISSNFSIVELHDFNNNEDNNHYLWDLNDFFHLDENKYGFPYETSLFELRGDPSYIIVFVPKKIVNEQLNDLSFIKKFSFKSFNDDAYEEINSVTYNEYIDKAIIGTFFMNDLGILVTISYKNPQYVYGTCIGNQFPKLDYTLNLYNENLEPIKPIDKIKMSLKDLFGLSTEYVYFKSIYLKSKYVMFAYITYCYLLLELFSIDINTEGSKIRPSNYDYMIPLYSNINNLLSDFIKINERKLIYIFYNYISSSGYTDFTNELHIKIIKIKEDYSDYTVNRHPTFNLGDYIPKMQLSGLIYNDFLIVTSTAVLRKDIYSLRKDINYFSIFMIFGYPNGTDSTIDISKFIFDGELNNIQPNNNFFDILFDNYKIGNNIFDYLEIPKIKLVSIPEEISLIQIKINEYNEILENNELKNNSFMLDNDYDYDYNYIYFFKEKKEIIKTSKYYYIDYQYTAINFDDDGEEPYYGRTNRLKFKLCHDYCETCYELGTSNKTQKCLSCLPEYQYNYFYFTSITVENSDKICVPRGYYYDIDEYELNLCEHHYKYYINTTDNKKICFPNEEYFPCPISYPLFNNITNECFNCDYEHFKNGECTEDNLKMESCTQCSYECFMIGGCNFDNFDTKSDDFYIRIKNGGYLSNYDGGEDLKIKNGDGFDFQITTIENELNALKEKSERSLSIIDFKECADLLRNQYGLNSNDDLVILKYENYNKVSNGNEKSIQYEVYLKNNNTKLDLSICDNLNMNIYIPIELSEETQKLIDSLKEQGYNIFDKNDKFYTDICTPYKSVDGTDVILADRVNEIYEKNMFKCQDNCEYSEYLPESNYLKCDCHITNEEKINTKNPEKVTAKSLKNTFINELKYSNYKVLKCYNLVFRKVTIKKNAGSILSNIYFIGYLIAFAIFCYTKGKYLKDEIEKLIGRNIDTKNNSSGINNDDISIYNKNMIFDKENFEQKRNNDTINEEKKGNQDVEIIKIKKMKQESDNTAKNSKKNINIVQQNYKKYFDNYVNGEKNPQKKTTKNKNKIKMDFSEQNKLGSKDGLVNKLAIFEEKKNNELSKSQSEKESNKSEKESKISDKEKGDLTDYELNELEYEEALELDNRKFWDIYWYLLKREHIILFTFINWNDFNLFSIKLSKLFVGICSDMAFNVFFFSDESMHEIYESGGGHGWTGQFAQMVYSTIISQILQIFLNYLTMTDIHYYQIKELKKDNKLTSEKLLSIIKCIKYKLIVYFASTFVLFLFFWYTASAFCAVYPNTQGIYIADSYTSFFMGLIYPFALYLAPAALRYISLKAKEKKNLKVLYSLSDKIPIF